MGKEWIGVVIETKMSVASKSTRASRMWSKNNDAEIEEEKEEAEFPNQFWSVEGKGLYQARRSRRPIRKEARPPQSGEKSRTYHEKKEAFLLSSRHP